MGDCPEPRAVSFDLGRVCGDRSDRQLARTGFWARLRLSPRRGVLETHFNTTAYADGPPGDVRANQPDDEHIRLHKGNCPGTPRATFDISRRRTSLDISARSDVRYVALYPWERERPTRRMSAQNDCGWSGLVTPCLAKIGCPEGAIGSTNRVASAFPRSEAPASERPSAKPKFWAAKPRTHAA